MFRVSEVIRRLSPEPSSPLSIGMRRGGAVAVSGARDSPLMDTRPSVPGVFFPQREVPHGSAEGLSCLRPIFSFLSCWHLLLARPVSAADCGGATPCSCGDSVIASRKLVRGVDPVTSAPCLGDGLIITAERVVLDLGWSTIQGSLAAGSVGIRVVGPADDFVALIGNSTIAEFGHGITGGEGVSVERVEVVGNVDAGIALRAGAPTGNGVRTSIARRNGGVGIEVWCGHIQDSHAEQNGSHGIVMRAPACDGFVGHVVSRENDGAGIFVRGDGGWIDGSLAVRNTSHGYMIVGEDIAGTRLQAVQNGAHGFAIEAAFSFFSGLRTKDNAGFGIAITPRNNPGQSGYSGYCQGDDLGDSDPPGLCK